MTTSIERVHVSEEETIVPRDKFLEGRIQKPSDVILYDQALESLGYSRDPAELIAVEAVTHMIDALRARSEPPTGEF